MCYVLCMCVDGSHKLNRLQRKKEIIRERKTSMVSVHSGFRRRKKMVIRRSPRILFFKMYAMTCFPPTLRLKK